IIIFDPNTVLSIGFQISFAAVWGIVAVNKLLQRPRYLRLPLYIRLITGYLTVTISATIATTPLVAYYFHNLPLWFIPTNIVAAFILPILLAVALPCILFSSATAGTFLPRMADTLYNLIASTSEQFASLSNPTVTSLYPPTWVVAMFYLAMIAGTILAIKHYRPRFVISSMIASMTFCLILVVALRPTTPRSEWFLHGIFTGTALVVTEDGVAWLVDDCPTDIVTRRLINRLEPRLADFLGRRGIDTLTVMPRRYTSKLIDRDGNSIVVGNKSFLFVDNNSVSPNEQGQQIDYLIITRGVTQNAAAIATRFKPRQVIMTASLNALISRRLEAELKDAGIEPVSLRDSIIHSSNAPFASNSR
ncbi:MAG: ComEC/Rec2 family competence protein, partial [Muribaculaceae bacterium]|nr:ComEC/Rec2 family competence protein [Muribaculaceae bacterium]